jgi:hypothetical protein
VRHTEGVLYSSTAHCCTFVWMWSTYQHQSHLSGVLLTTVMCSPPVISGE